MRKRVLIRLLLCLLPLALASCNSYAWFNTPMRPEAGKKIPLASPA